MTAADGHGFEYKYRRGVSPTPDFLSSLYCIKLLQVKDVYNGTKFFFLSKKLKSLGLNLVELSQPRQFVAILDKNETKNKSVCKFHLGTEII